MKMACDLQTCISSPAYLCSWGSRFLGVAVRRGAVPGVAVPGVAIAGVTETAENRNAKPPPVAVATGGGDVDKQEALT